ncbi:MAG: condensation domain-containing protein, partial [Methanococcaceae archaeon]
MEELIDRIKNLTDDKLGKLIDELYSESTVESVEPIQRRNDKTFYPISFSQKRMWFLQNMHPGSTFYNIPTVIKLTGNLNIIHLEKCLNEILRRHEIMRCYFVLEGSDLLQKLRDYKYEQLNVTDISKNSGLIRKQHRTIQDIINREMLLPFSLSQGPLYRINLIKSAEEEYILLMTFHHIVADGWSFKILAEELSDMYSQLQNGKTLNYSELSFQYFDYAIWQEEYLSKGVSKQQLDYWSEKLKGMPPVINLPLDKGRPLISKFEGGHLDFNISEDTLKSLKLLSRKAKTNLNTLLLAALGTLLHKYSSQEDFGIGIPVANRHIAGLEKLIGYFVNTVIV